MAPNFSDLTTMRVGGPTGELVTATDAEHLVELVREADSQGIPVLVLGGGSNLIVGDEGWPGRTVRIGSEGSELAGLDITGELVTAEAGVDWDRLVQVTLEQGLAGLETMSGIPGLTGATPVQNVGAFGTETSDVLESVTVYDRETKSVDDWPAARCGFGSHRSSAFKRSDRWIILRVRFRLVRTTESRPVRYAELAGKLGVEIGETAAAADVRQAVLESRRSRGSLLDPADHDTWTVGSFFLNPVVAEVPAAAAGAPQFADPKGVKIPAAWLIQHAGFPPGYGAEFGAGRVTLSTKHALAVSNRGGASTAEVMAFAGHVQAGVRDRFGLELQPECHLINCHLG